MISLDNSVRRAASIRHISVVAVLLLAVFLVSACSRDKEKHEKALAAHRVIFSPNGEPLTGGPLGHPTCQVVYSQWFDRVGISKPGIITKSEFLADAAVQFDRMDLNHDGVITPTELSDFRATYDFDPNVSLGSATREAPKIKDTDEEKSASWVVSRWTGDTPDPVMSADRSLRFRVSREDFMAQAEDNFAALDAGRKGVVTRETLLATCDKPGH
jgi:hypothetical protein